MKIRDQLKNTIAKEISDYVYLKIFFPPFFVLILSTCFVFYLPSSHNYHQYNCIINFMAVVVVGSLVLSQTVFTSIFMILHFFHCVVHLLQQRHD